MKFAEQTTIHGFRDWFDSSSGIIKAVWTLAMAATFVALVYESYSSVNTYLGEPIVTRIETRALNKFSTMIFCPKNWINQTKLNEMGLDDDSLRYILSFLFQYDETSIAFVRGSTKKFHDIKEHVHSQLPKSYRTKTLDELLFDITLDESNVEVSNVFKLPLQQAYITKIIKMRAVCYFVEFPTVSKSIIEFMKFNVLLQAAPDVKPATRERDYVSFDDSSLSFIDRNEIGIDLGMNLEIFIKTISMEYINSKHKVCKHWKFKDQFDCRIACLNKIAMETFGCEEYFPGQNFSLFNNACSSLQYGKIMYHQRGLLGWQSCRMDCPDACTFNSNFFTINQRLKSLNDTRSYFSVKLMDPLNSLVCIELPMYTWTTLLSNVGGLISLFCGASILSIVQIFTFFMNKQLNTIDPIT